MTGSLPLSTLKTCLRAWVLASSGLGSDKVIFANQNAPKPLPSYITIDPVRTIKPVGAYDEEINNTDGTIDYVSVRRIMSEVICYGANAQVVLNDCLFGLNHAGIWQDFRDNDFAIINREEISIKDLTYQINENEFVPRASMEITMDILCNAENVDLDYFDTVGYELQFNNDGVGYPQGLPVVEVSENLENSGNNNIFDPLNPVSDITASIGIDDVTIEWVAV